MAAVWQTNNIESMKTFYLAAC